MSSSRPLFAALALLAVAAPARASFINYSSREINVKVVYCGPPSVGLQDNLSYIYSRTQPEAKGKLISLASDADRVLFFDFLPPALGEIRGFRVRFHLYTALAKGPAEATWRLILKGADAVIFVADADPKQLEATLVAWKSLRDNLAAQGNRWGHFPLVVQLDHSDLPNAIALETMRGLLGLREPQPSFEAIASRGVGVFDSLKAVAKKILLALKGGAH